MILATSRRRGGIPLQLALLALVAAAFLSGIVPAGVLLDRWLTRELEARVHADLALAPQLLADRSATVGDAVMMHAKEVAHAPGLGEAIAASQREAAVRNADAAARALNSLAVVVGPAGRSWTGPPVPPAMLAATRGGAMPVRVVSDRHELYLASIAPVEVDGAWGGAAGVATPVDESWAGALAGLTRSEQVTVLAEGGVNTAGPAGASVPRALVRLAAREPADRTIHAVSLAGRRYLYTVAPLNGARVVFARDLDRALAIVGPLRRALAVSGVGALLLAVLLGAVLARQIARPVRSLAAAAGRLSRGDFEAPLASSPVGEVERVTVAFREMREALAARIGQLREANRMLEERQARLTALQAELIQRERVATSGRMAAELAHEIRNPVANLRNCLELLHRRLGMDPEGRQYASFAIDELLRMHELAERMLHLNRPRDPALGECDVGEVAREVAALARIGADEASISVRTHGTTRAAIVPDALKQVMLNLVQNARDAVPAGLRLAIDVRSRGGSAILSVEDNGPGIPASIREHVFDPFFTTRVSAGGVGLGLFVVEGIVRGNGGSVSVEDAPGHGARFRIRLPTAGHRAADAGVEAESPSIVA